MIDPRLQKRAKRISDQLVLAWVIATGVLLGAGQWWLALAVFWSFFLGAGAVLMDPSMTDSAWDKYQEREP